uniref:GATA-type domain-containing protein n=1 Tax=Opuntia streptacantha TaxID=393608 RepID=A0A7C8YQL6_OPUST
MLDRKEECSVSEDQSRMMNSPPSSSEMKRCTDCQTTTTPLWRGGPAGPKTLCNACGIKYHKKRRALLGIDKGKVEKSKKKNKNNNTNNSSNNGSIGMPLKIKVMASGIRQRENLEVEQAAMLLMALSYGSVYA